jgi:ferredoxin
MGHGANPDREYRLLQQRLDQQLTGAPKSPTFMKILRLLFSEEEAQVARRLPSRPTALDSLSRKLAIPSDELEARLTEMAQRGLVIDLECNGQRYFALPPVVIGFYEFTFMRFRDNVPMADLARLFEDYMKKDDRFTRGAFQGRTQIGRSLVREETLPQDGETEILDWERASRIITSASSVALSLCACRHKADHLGKACEQPQETCLTLNYAADAAVRGGFGRRITTDEAMDVLRQCKELGLAQTADNVQRKVTYICNCCGCCCGLMDAIKTFGIHKAVVTSNWISEIDAARCKACKKCAKACPAGAIDIVAEEKQGQIRRWAERDEALCLGCGVCGTACKFGAIAMKPRPQRVYTPETIFDKRISMAIERGKLSHLIFDSPERLSHRAMGRVITVLEKSPPFKAAMAVRSLRSKFLSALVARAARDSGELAEILM